MQTTPAPRPPFSLMAISSATAATITTPLGPIVNATGVTPTGGHAIVVTIDGTPYAIGWKRP
ncbi:hypothetical protein [Streptomyces sp. NPDC059247]|uniref:hypothetical protein n=1 Tax=Streptomyces sp. NPDC059247 TaxID=3346790 RepID=UPI0036CFB9EC